MRYKFPEPTELPCILELPDPFMKPDGGRISTQKEWSTQRDYLKELLAHYLYGHMPQDSGETKGEVVFSRPLYGGKALAETVRITAGRSGEIIFDADLIRPVKEGKVPVITWNQFTESHGSPIEEELVCHRSYAIMEFNKEQLAIDDSMVKESKLARAFPECDWGAIAMWAWGHTCLADYLFTTDWADTDKLVVTGHSRGGKAALCAAVYDERFAVCAPSCSGCGGAGCFRFLGGRYGEGIGQCETAGIINRAFGYWWSDNFHEFGTTRDETFLPFDMHFAKALIAPRALITTDGLCDTWANPFGTQVTWRAAQEVFDFLGVPGNNAIHFREGGHEFQTLDWLAIADFCDEIFFNKKSINNIVRLQPNPELEVLMDTQRGTKLHYHWSNPLAE